MKKPIVILQNSLVHEQLPSENDFQTWSNAVFDFIEKKLPSNITEVSIRLVDSEESATLNQTYRKKSGPTNVLSFPNDPEPELNDETLGDIAICADLVSEEAKAQNIPVDHHWAHLTIHGILHLLSYDHQNDSDAKVMEQLEIKILNALNIDDPYQEILND